MIQEENHATESGCIHQECDPGVRGGNYEAAKGRANRAGHIKCGGVEGNRGGMILGRSNFRRDGLPRRVINDRAQPK